MRRILKALGRMSGTGGEAGFSAVSLGAWLLVLRARGYEWEEWTNFKGKGLWEVLELLIIPVTLAVLAAALDRQERKVDREISENRARTDREIAEKRGETDREIALSNQQETALQNYLNFMTDLVLNANLKKSEPEDEIRKIARVKTITTLQGLDGKRKGKLIEFLYEIELVTGGIFPPIIVVPSADLNGANLSEPNSRGSFLTGLT